MVTYRWPPSVAAFGSSPQSARMTDEHPISETTTVVAGRAMTSGQVLPLGLDDPVIAARAVRRAVADAGWRATDIDAIVVACPPPLEVDAVRRFARRALGPHGDAVASVALETEDDRDGLVARATRSRPGSARRWIAVGITRDGTTVATCVAADATDAPGRPR